MYDEALFDELCFDEIYAEEEGDKYWLIGQESSYFQLQGEEI